MSQSYEIEGRRHTITWAGLSTAGMVDVPAIPPKCGPVLGSVQIGGTFGDATVGLTGSNDGATFSPLSDPFGAEISMTAPGFAELSTGAKWLRPSLENGTGDDITVTVVLWSGE